MLKVTDLEGLQEQLSLALETLRDGESPDYAAGVCHTLRYLGLYTEEELSIWAETPTRRAYADMLESAMNTLDRMEAEVGEPIW